MSSADFSQLPDPAWVNIMSRLSLADRSRVSQTCHAMNAIFNHPSVWLKVNISLMASLSDRASNPAAYPLVMPERFEIMIRRFGVYFQDLTLKISGHVALLDQSSEDVLTMLAESCRLHSLTLEVGELLARGTTSISLETSKLKALATILRKAFRLQSLKLVSWPIHPRTTDFDILQCLCENEKIKQLTDLSLFWCNPASKSWMPVNAYLPSPASVLDTVKHFTSLNCLRLCSAMISEEVINELCQPGRVHLGQLAILVTYVWTDRKTEYPHISNYVWRKLRKSCPGLSVELVFTNTFVHEELLSFLSPDIPLAYISFMRHSRFNDNLIFYLAENYSKTLRAFYDFGGFCKGEADSYLLELVSRCSSLDVLVYSGQLKSTTVLLLARLRGPRWMDFRINFNNVIIISQSPDDSSAPPEDVIFKDVDGEIHIVAHLPFFHPLYRNDDPELQMKNFLDVLSNEVGQILCQKWTPFVPEVD